MFGLCNRRIDPQIQEAKTPSLEATAKLTPSGDGGRQSQKILRVPVTRYVKKAYALLAPFRAIMIS